MKIHELKIEGFKSIGEIKLVEPNPFSVFVGPNAAGKSNIFEALEFMELCNFMETDEAIRFFGNPNDIFNQTIKNRHRISFSIDLGSSKPFLEFIAIENGVYKSSVDDFGYIGRFKNEKNNDESRKTDYHIFTNFTRLFVNNNSKVKRNLQDDSRLASDGSNLEIILKRILRATKNRDEIIEILQLLIPGFSNVEIKTADLSGSDNLLVYEDALDKPLTKRLISDGTYNILALITAIYQSEKPQFLCIEEPENGLNPKVVRQLVSLFRDKCKEKGHYIWLNTHSQTLVSELTPEEIILVDKVNGNTEVKQVKGFDLHGMKMDEALLTNALGGGIPW